MLLFKNQRNKLFKIFRYKTIQFLDYLNELLFIKCTTKRDLRFSNYVGFNAFEFTNFSTIILDFSFNSLYKYVTCVV